MAKKKKAIKEKPAAEAAAEPVTVEEIQPEPGVSYCIQRGKLRRC